MSLYRRVEDEAEHLSASASPLRQRFAAHLQRVAAALRAIEDVDSGDMFPGDEEEAIQAVLR